MLTLSRLRKKLAWFLTMSFLCSLSVTTYICTQSTEPISLNRRPLSVDVQIYPDDIPACGGGVSALSSQICNDIGFLRFGADDHSSHMFGLQIRLENGRVHPRVHFKLPLDRDVQDMFDSIFGININFSGS